MIIFTVMKVNEVWFMSWSTSD